jgi:predicted DNA-binding transcriptional regulator AlpA
MMELLDQTPSLEQTIGFYSDNELDVITSLSRVTRWRMVRRGTFPAPVELSPGRKGTPKPAVHAWIRERMEAATKTAASSVVGV